MFESLIDCHPAFHFFQEKRYKVFHVLTVFEPLLFLKSKKHFLDCNYSTWVVFRLERCLSCCQFKDSDSQRPNINSFIVSSSWEHFRCHIKIGSNNCQHISSFSSQKSFLGNTKVNYLDSFVLFVIKNVVRFYVSMTDIFLVKIVESIKDFFNNHF